MLHTTIPRIIWSLLVLCYVCCCFGFPIITNYQFASAFSLAPSFGRHGSTRSTTMTEASASATTAAAAAAQAKKLVWGRGNPPRVPHRRSHRASRLQASSSPSPSSESANGLGPANGDTAARKGDTAGTATPRNAFWPSVKPRDNNAKARSVIYPGEPGTSSETGVDVTVGVSAEFCNTDGVVGTPVGLEEYDYDDDDEDAEGYHDCDYYDAVFDSIVKIYATHSFEPDTTMPWQKQQSYTSYSSGFVISERRILTNAHSVEYAGQVLVRRRGSSQKYRATIEIVANECDLAVLTIEDESFWTTRTYDDEDEYDDYDYDDGDGNENDEDPESKTGDDDDDEETVPDTIRPLEFGVLPELQDEVEVLGYPTGGDSLSVTKGVVSRIEATEYAQCSGSHLLAIQIDAAINGGNSGGPVVDATTGRVVGVAFQALENAENIGYVVPVTVVLHFLEDIKRHGAYSGVTCLGVRFSRLENESMRRYLKLPPKESPTTKKNKRGNKGKPSNNPNTQGGVVVRSCNPTCPSKNVLKENDVILSIDGIPVASDGNVPFRRNGRERVSFASYVQTKFADDTVELDLWRDGGPQRVTVPLAISSDLVPSHWNNQAPPYLIAGGLVFTALSVPYLEDCGAWGEYVSDSLNYLTNKIHEPLERPDDQVVVLINVLAHPRNTGYDGLTNLHLHSLNGKNVRSLKHLRELISAEQEQQRTQQQETDDDDDEQHYLRFEFGSKSSGDGGGILVVFETDSIEDINREVCEEHSIQKPFYFPPSSPETTRHAPTASSSTSSESQP